ncbi:hypothetical protein ACHAWF_017502 [Thalassiosira exigua]
MAERSYDMSEMTNPTMNRRRGRTSPAVGGAASALALACLAAAIGAVAAGDGEPAPLRFRRLTRDRLSKILHTSLDDPETFRHRDDDVGDERIEEWFEEGGDGGDDRERRRRALRDEEAWDRISDHGWDRSLLRRRVPARRGRDPRSGGRNLRSASSVPDEGGTGGGEEAGGEGGAATNSPFVACSEAPNRSGYRRRQSLAAALRVPLSRIQTIYNADEESCFLVAADGAALRGGLELEDAADGSDSSKSSDSSSNSSSPLGSIHLGPLADVLKLPPGSASNVLEDPEWTPPVMTTVADALSLKRSVTREFSYDNATELVDVDVRRWVRSISVDLIPGTVSSDVDGRSIEDAARDIVDFVTEMAQVPPGSASARPSPQSSPLSSGLRGNGTLSERMASELPLSTREAFSLTAWSEGGEKRTFRNPHSVWSTALKRGFEAEHGCQVMLDTLEVRPRGGSGKGDNGGDSGDVTGDGEGSSRDADDADEDPVPPGFELLLRPPSQFLKDAAVRSSAWNPYCALSLLVGLAVHPAVQAAEVGRPLVQALMTGEGASADDGAGASDFGSGSEGAAAQGDGDFEGVPKLSQHSGGFAGTVGKTNPQWILQSSTSQRRPFFDVGLDGTGQIGAVADGGLDRDNCYFRDASPSDAIFGVDAWDTSQRKVVHYDDTFGDRTERATGHGTYVGGIMSGSLSTDGRTRGAGHADGTAPGAKLAFFDMENGYDGIADPGPNRLLRSLYNPGGSVGARVITASWGRTYGGRYTSFCRQYDAALRDSYPEMTLVVSAGNTGRTGTHSVQDPADCKNTLAVGSSMSAGTDARDGELGIEYLADYSSRGPAEDGRMKPDVVAPGHFILAPRADPGFGECDGDRHPDVKASSPVGGAGIKYTTGTSMAAPALAGAAIILRQYLAEGYCDADTGECCGSKGCGSAMTPIGGALIKAMLMNGARPLTGGVQYVPSGRIIKEQPLSEYDNNQGYGRADLSNSVPLRGENNMNMIVVNDKNMYDGGRDVYTVHVDKSNGCDRPLSATLAWYDAPAQIGCMRCIVNDLDLSVRIDGSITYPNGRNDRDSTNTVERVRINAGDGEEVQIVVNAQNFALASQKYSLAVTGCFTLSAGGGSKVERTATPPTPRPTRPPTLEFSDNSSSNTAPSCPSSRLFQIALKTADDGAHLTWTLISSSEGGGVHYVAASPQGGYDDYRQYREKVCLESDQRYRFQMRNKSGDAIRASYLLIYGGSAIFNTRQSAQALGRASTFRFQTDGDGTYGALGSNAFTTNFQSGDEVEVGAHSFEPSAELGSTVLSSSSYVHHEEDSEFTDEQYVSADGIGEGSSEVDEQGEGVGQLLENGHDAVYGDRGDDVDFIDEQADDVDFIDEQADDVDFIDEQALVDNDELTDAGEGGYFDVNGDYIEDDRGEEKVPEQGYKVYRGHDADAGVVHELVVSSTSLSDNVGGGQDFGGQTLERTSSGYEGDNGPEDSTGEYPISYGEAENIEVNEDIIQFEFDEEGGKDFIDEQTTLHTASAGVVEDVFSEDSENGEDRIEQFGFDYDNDKMTRTPEDELAGDEEEGSIEVNEDIVESVPYEEESEEFIDETRTPEDELTGDVVEESIEVNEDVVEFLPYEEERDEFIDEHSLSLLTSPEDTMGDSLHSSEEALTGNEVEDGHIEVNEDIVEFTPLDGVDEDELVDEQPISAAASVDGLGSEVIGGEAGGVDIPTDGEDSESL